MKCLAIMLLCGTLSLVATSRGALAWKCHLAPTLDLRKEISRCHQQLLQ
jgi:hypothetical protein